MILIAPSFDGRRHGGIERVSRQVLAALERGAFGTGGHLVLASNDEPEAARKAYGRRYFSMVVDALRMPLDGVRGPILCLHAGLSPVARLLSRRLRVPYAVFLHGIEVWRRLPLRTRWGLAGAGRLLANSRFTLSRFAQWHPRIAEKPSKVVPLGLADAFETSSRREVSSGGSFILTVSRLSLEDSYKGHPTLMEAVIRLRRDGRDVHLVIVGSGDAEQSLKNRSVELGDPGACIFTGSIGDGELLRLYRQCAVFSLLSEGEGFGLVFLEAMSQGKPCLAANADAAAEVVEDGVTGVLIQPRDVSAAVRALDGLLGDEPQARRLGEAGRQRVQSHFLESHFIERLKQALQ